MRFAENTVYIDNEGNQRTSYNVDYIYDISQTNAEPKPPQKAESNPKVLLDFKYDIFKHPKFSLTEDGGAKPYIHNEVNRDVADIEILNISLKDIEKIDVPDFNYELITETELEKELEKESNSNEKTE